MSQSSPGRREVAYRAFAAEFDDAEFSYSESDEERAPNYVVTPTGARVNRLFAVGVLTEVESVNPEMVRGRVVDTTGAFVTYAGQYQPDELAYLERTDPPTFLALAGKARTFEPEDGDRIFTSVRPESVNEVDAETRDRWVVTTAERTLERIGIVASAIESGLAGDRLRTALEAAGVDERLADGVALALEYYDTTPAYLEALRTTALEAVEVVAGERDEAESQTPAPGDGEGDATSLATLELSEPPSPEPEAPAAGDDGRLDDDAGDGAGSVETAAGEPGKSGETADSEARGESGSEPDSGVEPDPEADVTVDGSTSGPLDDETGDQDDPGEFELDEEARTEVEEEYGTEFSTAGEVDSPEDADATGEGDALAEEEVAETDDAGTEAPAATDGDSDVDLEDAVVETMETLDDGDGADRAALVSSVVEEHGVATDDVEAAIQDALMSGRCYEPSDGTLKSI